MTILAQADKQPMVQSSLLPQTQHTECSGYNIKQLFRSQSNSIPPLLLVDTIITSRFCLIGKFL